MKKAFILISLISLSSCASFNGSDTGLIDFARSDVEKALAIAESGGDEIGANCWRAVLDNYEPLPELTIGEDIGGAASLLQRARLVRIRVDDGIPSAIHVNCAPLAVDAQRTVLRIGLLNR